jgi:hypothetical protein
LRFAVPRRGKHVMRSAQYIYATVLTFALVGTAAAQTAPPPSPAPTQSTYASATETHWLASGFVGGGWSATSDSPRVDTNSTGADFGGQIAWLWRGYVGPEFLANWTPSFDVTSTLIDGSPHVANYMVNAIGAYPLGADGRFQPYISGGFGRTAIGADFLSVDGNSRKGGWGSDIGGGVMAFVNKVGVRGDIRYYHAHTINDFSGTADEQILQSVLSGLAYWQATGGVSFRW